MGDVPARPPRDLRLDVLRGWMQISIFVSHIAGTAFGVLIHAGWGLSDSSEQFVFLSGFGLGSVFALKAARDGFPAGLADLRDRTWRLYLKHLLVAFVFAVLVFGVEPLLPGEVARLGWTHLGESPGQALVGLVVMLYQPDFTGILPLFVACMLLLPAAMWLFGRVGVAALLPSALLWAGAQAFGWSVPGLGGTELAFNPFAWQFLFLLGAWSGRAALLAGAAGRRADPRVTAVALAIVLAGIAIRLADHLGLDEAQLSRTLLAGKEHLAWPRLLHALALAWLVAALLPRDAAWLGGVVARHLAAVGRHSLDVFCLGLFLSWGAGALLRLHPEGGLLLDAACVVGGAATLLAFAAWLERRGARADAKSRLRRA
jgi:hypothetical protein